MGTRSLKLRVTWRKRRVNTDTPPASRGEGEELRGLRLYNSP